MDIFNRFFTIGVIALDLLAVVYFGGHFLVTGHILPHTDQAHAQSVAQLVPVEEVKNTGVKPQARKKAPLMPASAERGARVAGLCLSCHSFEKNGRIMTGPPLWNIVDAPLAAHDGYQYSQVFLEQKTKGVTWTVANLDAFLASPRKFTSGTKMSFAGLRKEQQRIDLIEYLKSLK